MKPLNCTLQSRTAWNFMVCSTSNTVLAFELNRFHCSSQCRFMLSIYVWMSGTIQQSCFVTSRREQMIFQNDYSPIARPTGRVHNHDFQPLHRHVQPLIIIPSFPNFSRLQHTSDAIVQAIYFSESGWHYCLQYNWIIRQATDSTIQWRCVPCASRKLM